MTSADSILSLARVVWPDAADLEIDETGPDGTAYGDGHDARLCCAPKSRMLACSAPLLPTPDAALASLRVAVERAGRDALLAAVARVEALQRAIDPPEVQWPLGLTRARRLETCVLCSRPIPDRDLVLSRDERPAHRECAEGADYREQCAREDAMERRAEARRDR